MGLLGLGALVSDVAGHSPPAPPSPGLPLPCHCLAANRRPTSGALTANPGARSWVPGQPAAFPASPCRQSPSSRPANRGYCENTAAANPEDTALPRQLRPKGSRHEIESRRRSYSWPGSRKTVTGQSWRRVPEELGPLPSRDLAGVWGRSAAGGAGTRLGSGTLRLREGTRDGPLGDAMSFTMGSQARTRERRLGA